jgi:predicted ATPase
VQAAKALGQAKTLAAETGHFATTALALLFGCIAAVLRRDPAALKEPANELLALSRRHGSQYWELHGQTFVAQFQATEGHLEEALDRIRQCFSGWQARDSAFMRPWLKLMEAELLGNLGRQLEALRHLDEAQELIERTEIRFCEPELHRLRAGTLSARGASDAEVEACFEEAIRIARGQSAKFWELRAASNWARFCRERQRHAQARQLLSEVYNSFTEGFDTPDLQEARALLDSLGVVTAPNTAAAQTRPTRKCADS